MQNKLQYLPIGAARYAGIPEQHVEFTLKHQLLSRETWGDFVRVFTEDSDDHDLGWRCEFFGKMMRGAALVYRYTGNEELYRVMTEATLGLLDTQRADGRISTYGSEAQLNGWDLWGRKYVLTGLLHYREVCRDEALRARILKALCRHADAILEKVGVGEGKIEITKASTHWLGANSASILEPMLALYRETGEERYLAFSEYVLATGGIDHPESMVALALRNEIPPYLYPQTKAYETMSFFEGVLAYYEVTGKTEYLRAVLNFVEAVYETDITVIGCSGCTHELFDHSAVMQTETPPDIMQETCVTVTWMRILARLHLLTGEKKYFDRIEISALNSLYGSVNTELEKSVDTTRGITLEIPVPFDSYAPLYNGRRGDRIGGMKRFSFGGYYGCCACIASAGIALLPLTAVLADEGGVVVNTFLSGKLAVPAPSGRTVILTADSRFPETLDYTLTAETATESSERLTLSLRLPDYAEDVRVTVNGEPIAIKTEQGYLRICREWRTGDTVALSAALSLRTVSVNTRSAFLRGPLVLARDMAKDRSANDLTEEIALLQSGKGPDCTLLSTESGEMLRLTVARADGKPPMLLTDFASAGKRWNGKRNLMTVWFNLKK